MVKNKILVALALITLAQQKTTQALGLSLNRITQQNAQNATITSMLRQHMQVIVNDPAQMAQLQTQALLLRMQQLREREEAQRIQAEQMRAALKDRISTITSSMIGLLPQLYQWTHTGFGYTK